MLTIKVKTSGAAFDPEYGGNKEEELVRILTNVSHRILNGETEGKTMDIFGNTCGEWKLTKR